MRILKFVTFIPHWENFTVVEQDKPGVVVNGTGGLYTSNLFNCLCLILTNEETKYGMLHVNPSQPKTPAWIASLRTAVRASAAIVTGANGPSQSDERKAELATALAGLTVVDETRAGWVPASLSPVRGTTAGMVGYAAVCGTTGQYMLSHKAFNDTPKLAPKPTKPRRGSADGGCSIQ